ncbi:3-oxoacyl-[acyl-carrier-protein] reductase [candidate division KSB1 bacterium]|nr:3-oxoacyl-[acyl-carrier-protein] reductase [candidate division KSB1 bacterium]MCH8954578.1 3-oxoacyl-[acyl-carrier-protein] reductase [candidate division KSB1 bacterium]
MKLKDKVAIVTGSARGIGRAIALELVRNGAKLVICDLNMDDIQIVVDQFTEMGGEAKGFVSNVTQAEDAQQLIDKTIEAFGKVDILVNNAGITRDNLLMRMKEDEWDAVIAVNLKGTYNCIRAIAKPFIKQRSGKIINLASVVGQIGNAGQVNYSASKAGVIGLTKSVAKELAARNVRVNAIAPGFIQTDMTAKLTEKAKEELTNAIPLGKLGQPEDVAKVVLFLASDDAAYITGQVINVDGGMVM